MLRELNEMDGDKSGFQKQFEVDQYVKNSSTFQVSCIVIQLLEELSEEGDISEANANMEKNRYTYNLPCEFRKIHFNN